MSVRNPKNKIQNMRYLFISNSRIKTHQKKLCNVGGLRVSKFNNKKINKFVKKSSKMLKTAQAFYCYST